MSKKDKKDKVVSTKKLVGAYLSLRGKKEELSRELKERTAEITSAMGEIEAILMRRLEEVGGESLRTKKGTIIKSTVDFAQVEDRDEFLGYVRDTNRFDLLQVQAAKLAVREFIKENEVGAIPGVKYGQKTSISVRKPSTK